METEKAVTSRPEPLLHVVVETDEKKSVYMFLLHVYGPNIYSLYAVEVPPEIHDDDRILCPIRKPDPEALSPILEFPRKKYPWSMCCVQLDSKLYFFGGELEEREGLIGSIYPPDVHVFDPAATEVDTTSNIAAASETTTKLLLREAPKMCTGKFIPMAFVVERRIFVVSGLKHNNKTGGNLSRFEVFDPDACGGSGEWTRLEDPPFSCRLNGHAVVHRMVFILTGDDQVYSYDLDSYQWLKVARDISMYKKFQGEAELVEGTYYACTLMRVTCFRLNASSSSSSSPRLKLFSHLAHVSPDVIRRDFPTLRAFPSASLTHMGKKRFCYVMAANAALPTCSDVEDPERCYLSLTMFEAFEDTYSEGHHTFFRAEFLRSALFIINPSSSVTFITHSFTLPSCRFQQIV